MSHCPIFSRSDYGLIPHCPFVAEISEPFAVGLLPVLGGVRSFDLRQSDNACFQAVVLFITATVPFPYQ